MNHWKKVAAVAAALLILGGASSAMAGDDPNPQPPPSSPRSVGSDDTRILGGNVNEATLVPITPCRLVDTRQAGGKLQTGGARTFRVRGSGASFAAQGGLANGCGIPSGATAIEVTITAVDAGSGFLRVWPAGQSQPNATFMNYTEVFNVSNTGTVTICGASGGVCTPNQDLLVRAYGSATHVVIDVAGYYTRQIAAEVTGAGQLIRSNRAASASRLGIGNYEVVFDRNVSDCVLEATIHNGNGQSLIGIAPRGGVPNAVFVQTTNAAGSDVDRRFFVTVTC